MTMVPEKASGIVLRVHPYSETSCVATVYTREFGKLRALAKGAWRTKNAFDSALDLLSCCQVLVLRRSSGGLDLLTEAALESAFRVGRNAAGFHGGMYVAELLDAFTAEADPQPELFDAARATITALSSDAPAGQSAAADVEIEAGLLVLGFELELLRHSGQSPALHRCSSCREPLAATARTAFGLLDGGCLCPQCRRGCRFVVSVSAGALAILRDLARRRGRPAGPLSIPDPRTIGEVRSLMHTLISHLLGRRLRSAGSVPPAPLRRRTTTR